MATGLQRLVPVAVPWEVSPSVPCLQLQVSEEDGQAAVRFMANFPSPQALGEAVSCSLDTIQVAYPTAELGAVRPVEGSGPRIVMVTFERSRWMRFSPAWGDHEVVKESDYDWSVLPSLTIENFEEQRRQFHATWLESGICPDPRFYAVLGSRWLQEKFELGSSCTHYIVLGHDAYVEVIAAAATWRCEDSEPVALELFPGDIVVPSSWPPSPRS